MRGFPGGSGSGVVTAVVQVHSLAPEPSVCHGPSQKKKKKKKKKEEEEGEEDDDNNENAAYRARKKYK